MTSTTPGPDTAAITPHAGAVALFRIAERHAATPEARNRQVNENLVGPQEAVRLAVMLGAGSAAFLPDEPLLDDDDVTAALALIPWIRAEIDEEELSLLMTARGRGLTWSRIATSLGLESAQAAQQRYGRLTDRVDPDEMTATADRGPR